jgi:hypothetical protein
MNWICVTLTACALVSTTATAQQIVKWTDEQGQVHFSDHAPPGQNATHVVVEKPPKSTPPPAPADQQTQANSSSTRRWSTSHEPGEAAPDSEAARRAAAAQAQQRRWDEQNKAAAAARQKADQDLIAQCKANRETYCNQSANAIRKQEHTIAEMQYLDAVTHHQELADRGISSPPPRPPPPLNNGSN